MNAALARPAAPDVTNEVLNRTGAQQAQNAMFIA
jgi:hypothetical protein